MGGMSSCKNSLAAVRLGLTKHPKVVKRRTVTLLGGPLEPANSDFPVRIDTVPVHVKPTQIGLCRGIALVGGTTIPICGVLVIRVDYI